MEEVPESRMQYRLIVDLQPFQALEGIIYFKYLADVLKKNEALGRPGYVIREDEKLDQYYRRGPGIESAYFIKRVRGFLLGNEDSQKVLA